MVFVSGVQGGSWTRGADIFALFFQRWMLPVYSALHLIPMIVLRHKHFMRDPLGMLRKAAFGIFRSSSFLGLFVTIYQGETPPKVGRNFRSDAA